MSVSLAVRLAAVLTATLAAAPSPADACSCGRPAMQRRMIPASGATGIATDAQVRVFLSGGYPTALRQQLRNEYRIRDASGTLIRIATQVVGRRLDLMPASRLRPHQRYQIEQLIAFDDKGNRLSDDERWAIATGRASGTARVAWFPVAHFETGPGRSRRAPPAVTVGKTELYYAHGGGDCGPAVSLRVEYTGPLAPTDVVELEVDGAVLDSFPGGGQLWAGDTLCNTDPVRIPAAPRAVKVRTRTLSGGVVSSKAVRPKPPSASPPQSRRRRPSDGKAETLRWSKAPLIASPRAAGGGPAACPDGFVAGKRARISATGGPWMYEGLGAIDWSGKRGWVAVNGPREGATSLFHIENGSRLAAPTALRGSAPQVSATADAAFVASREYKSSSPRFETVIHVTRVDNGGKVAWRRAFGPVSSQREPRIVAGGGRVLAAWSRTDVHRTGSLDNVLCWVSLDARTGRDVASSGKACRPTAGDGYLGLTRLPRGFAIAHHKSAPGAFRPTGLELQVIPDRGAAQIHALKISDTTGGVDLAADGNRVGLVTTTRSGDIVWALVDRKGKLTVGPVAVSKGVGSRNRKPRVAVSRGLFAVTWERRHADRTYAAAVDRRGRVSPALELGAGAGTSTAGIAVRPGGFMASTTGERGGKHPVFIEPLSCGKSAKPPQKLKVTW